MRKSEAQATGYSRAAHATFDELERRVVAVHVDVQDWRGWRIFTDPETPPALIAALAREVLRGVAWYQGHTTEAGFLMFGRLPKTEVRLMQQFSAHKARYWMGRGSGAFV